MTLGTEQPPSGSTEPAGGVGTGGGRLVATRDWLRGRADSGTVRLALLWFRRYMQASRNSGAAVSMYFALSALPTALVIVAYFNPGTGSQNAFAQRLITHMRLNGSTAGLAKDLFGTTANNLLAATLTVVIGFLLWGLAIGQIYQDLYARVWRIGVGTVADQWRYTVWYFLACGLLALMALSVSNPHTQSWFVQVPIWIAGSIIFWLWTPYFLLHGKIALRSLLPGALVAAFVVGGTNATAPLWMGPLFNQNANAFGSFGVVLAGLAYTFIVITISMVCAVFPPVWTEWRQGEKQRKERT